MQTFTRPGKSPAVFDGVPPASDVSTRRPKSAAAQGRRPRILAGAWDPIIGDADH